MKHETDHFLVAATLAGDANALGLIMERYQSVVFAAAFRSCGSRALSEDVCQETFVVAWKALASLSDPSELKSWLCSIARNRTRDAMRRRRSEVLTEDGNADLETLGTISDEPSPLTLKLDQEEREILWHAIHKLPAIYRDPLILFHERAATAAQIARTLEISVDAVKQRMHRAKILLREASQQIQHCMSGAETSLVANAAA